MSLTVVSLPPDTANFVAGVISSGRYPSVDDVVIAALRLLQSREGALSELGEQIDEGLNDYLHATSLTSATRRAIVRYSTD